MNSYVLGSLIAFILISMGITSVIVGWNNYSANRGSKTSTQMLYLLISTFLWDFGYAWMSMCYNSDFAYIARAISLFAVITYLFFLLRYVAVLTKISEKPLIPYYILYLIGSLWSWFYIIQPSAVEFSVTPWGYWYTSTMTPARMVQFISNGSATIVYYIIVIRGLKRATLARDKYILKGYLWFGPILYVGYFADTLVPSIFHTAAIPGSAIGAFFSTMLLFRLSKRNKSFGISKDNISEYVFEDVDIPVIITDHKQNIALYNNSVPVFFECDEDAFNNISFKDFLISRNASGIEHLINNDENEIITMNVPSKVHIEFKISTTFVYDRFNELMYSIHFIQDMTEEQAYLRELESSQRIAQDANMAKSNFLANMSHEIRTPMNAIIGMSEIIFQNYPDNEALTEVGQIKSAANNLLGIINDILDLSKIESGKYELINDDYALSSLINDVSSVIRVRVQESGTRFNVLIDPDMPEKLFGDQNRVRQILLNLLGNAVKFTKQGDITLKATWNKDKSNPELLFDVSDNGIGIKPEDIDTIFGAFNQVDTRKNRNIQGTGLGLAISKQLAQLMDGDITVDSVYGEGSTFHARIKQNIKEYVAIGSQTAEALQNATFTNTVRAVNEDIPDYHEHSVLIVDDVKLNLIIAEGLLKRYKLQIDKAQSGAEAIKLVQQKDYDIVFMDHMMPEMDGIDTTKAIRALGGKYEDLTIIALTANALTEAKAQFLSEGMQDFLAKPIDPKKLEEMLSKWLTK